VDLGAEVHAGQQVINAAAAVQALRVAQYASRQQEQDTCGAWVEVDHGLGTRGRVRARLLRADAGDGVRRRRAQGRHRRRPGRADPRLGPSRGMSSGDLGPWRATIIATQLCEANAASCATVEALIYPAVLEEPPGAVTKRVRPLRSRVDADALRLKAAKERLDRFVRPYRTEIPGLTTLGRRLARRRLRRVLGGDRRRGPPDGRAPRARRLTRQPLRLALARALTSPRRRRSPRQAAAESRPEPWRGSTKNGFDRHAYVPDQTEADTESFARLCLALITSS
jgi:hypothetical protein